MNKGMGQGQSPRRMINCDQASWLMAALDRYRQAVGVYNQFPSISRLGAAATTAAAIEIIDALHLSLDEDAARNITAGLRREMQRYVKDKVEEG